MHGVVMRELSRQLSFQFPRSRVAAKVEALRIACHATKAVCSISPRTALDRDPVFRPFVAERNRPRNWTGGPLRAAIDLRGVRSS